MKDKNHYLINTAQNIKKCLADFPELVHCWRFLAGVIYALLRYAEISSCSSSESISDEKAYIQEMDIVLTSILNNETPKENWQKGFYYNAALMRLDAAYERFFKAYLGRQGMDGPKLYKEIRDKFSSLFPKEFEDSNFGKVRHEVNSLKHYVGGADLTEREQPEILQQALIELVAFLKNPIVREKLNKFSGNGIITGRQ